jgi:hypothetical protein
MNKMIPTTLLCFALCSPGNAYGEASDPIFLVSIPEMNCRQPYTPLVALQRFHDAWQVASGTNIIPSFFFAGATNVLHHESFYTGFEVHHSEARTVLPIVGEMTALRHKTFTNAVVFFPQPFFEGQVLRDDIPVSPAAAKILGFDHVSATNSEKFIQGCLASCGIEFPSGCGASYNPEEHQLTVCNLGFENEWTRILVERAEHGASTTTASQDGALHLANQWYHYGRDGWRQCAKPGFIE